MECKYYNKCGLSSDKALTCTENGGGEYCGKYRMISAESSPCPVSFLCHPLVCLREMLASGH